MSKYLVSFGDSDKYAVEFPGSLEEFKNSDVVKNLTEKVDDFVKGKFPMGNVLDVIPLHIEEADNTSGYENLDASKIGDIIKNALTQVGVENFTDKLNLNAPFDKI